MIVITVGIMYAYQRKKTTTAIKLNEIKNEYEKLMLNAQLEIQDQTIQEISREIHDNIGLSLTLAKLNINTITEPHNLETRNKIHKCTELLGKAISDLRALSHSMNSEIIKSSGILKAIKSEINRVGKTSGINIELSVIGTPFFLPSQNDLIVYRVFQESINNILKHAKATLIDVQIKFSKELFELIIKDNGEGFNINQLTENGGAGIKIMRSRMQQIDGLFLISSNSNGTNITIQIPNKLKTND